MANVYASTAGKENFVKSRPARITVQAMEYAPNLESANVTPGIVETAVKLEILFMESLSMGQSHVKMDGQDLAVTRKLVNVIAQTTEFVMTESVYVLKASLERNVNSHNVLICAAIMESVTKMHHVPASQVIKETTAALWISPMEKSDLME